ncbi:MAG TPA: hypothetical protein VH722_15560 [Alphaproteobacteria bacterium]|jgi:hypothetical protein|nr:hypothetical protein [Alphaproteobacteria bacterium]
MRLSVDVGPVTVDLRFESARMAEMFAPALAVRSDRPADYVLQVSSGETGKPPAAIDADLLDGEMRFSADKDGYALWFGRYAQTLHTVDYPARRAAYWIPRADDIPAWERTRPFLPAFQAMLSPTDWVAVHAAGIADGERGILLVGQGKAGKTSLALAALEAGWRFAGDDFVAVRADGDPAIAPLYATARLRADMAGRFPALRPAEREISHDDGETRHELQLRALHSPPSITGAPLAAVLLLRRRGAPSPTFSPVSNAAVLSAMAAATATATPGYDAIRLRKYLRLLAVRPPLAFDPGPDFAAALAALREHVA